MQELNQEVRILGRVLARELTPEEALQISGGGGGEDSNENFGQCQTIHIHASGKECPTDTATDS